MKPRRLYAHRGASAERPENTMPAFERAIEIGRDIDIALELDVHLTRDGHFIVVHDDTGERMTGARTAWRDLDLVDAQRLDAGWGFIAPDGTRPFAGHGISVPLFADVLAAFPDTVLNVDIKGGDAVPRMLELLRSRDAEHRVTLASFQTRTLVAVRRAGFAGDTGLSQGEIGSLFSLPALLWRQLPFTGNCAQVPVRHGPLHFDRAAFIAKCHSIGLRVDYWTVDDEAEAKRLLDLGADGIMTNDPARLKSLFQ